MKKPTYTTCGISWTEEEVVIVMVTAWFAGDKGKFPSLYEGSLPWTDDRLRQEHRNALICGMGWM